MDKSVLKHNLDTVIKNYETKLESLQSRGYQEELQCAINELSFYTVEALKDFEKAILDVLD